MSRPYLPWPSPISSQAIVSKNQACRSVVATPQRVFFLESRPTESGRSVIASSPLEDLSSCRDATPAPDSGFNVRTRVHEYGGGEWLATPTALYFSNFKDQVLYTQPLLPDGSAGDPTPVSQSADTRFADYVLDERRQRLIGVREDHSGVQGGGEPTNTICAVSLADGTETVLVDGHDFFASPRLSPDGLQLAWVSWDHPSMPWDASYLTVGQLSEAGDVTESTTLAGGPDESVQQPRWDANGRLYCISDATGWWGLHRVADGRLNPVLTPEADLGRPSWLFGATTYCLLPSGAVLAALPHPTDPGLALGLFSGPDEEVRYLPSPYTGYADISLTEAPGGGLVLAVVGTSSLKPTEVAVLQVASESELAGCKEGDWAVLRSAGPTLDPGYLSQPVELSYPSTGGATAHMQFYEPNNKDASFPEGKLPPLLVKIHGGPTASASTAYQLGVQFWTSRGFAVADINYGGSTGYGREYRNRLRGAWGVVDVDDCAAAATWLADTGRVDPGALCITGGSAGGYTTLACLAFKDVFSAGASHYGVADMELLAKETHKFESRYLDSLVGAYPEQKALYEARSPIHSLEGFEVPVAFFQGEEDVVVPPNQSVLMFEELKRRGVTTALALYPGEQHGFRGAGTIRHALDGELCFYGAALGFSAPMPEDLDIPPLDIINAPAAAAE